MSGKTNNLRKQILDVLGEDPLWEENVLKHKSRISLNSEDENVLYVELFNILSDISLSPPEAKALYESVHKNKEEMEKSLNREVGFRVAMLDYFLNKGHLLKNPKIIELYMYEQRTALALIDSLTGIYNRRYLDDFLTKEVNRALRHGLSFALMFIDLDDFKKVNDTHGHAAGDTVLKEIAALLKDTIRGEDVVGRFGGEEFLVIMPETDLPGANTLAERLLDKTRELKPAGIRVTFSAGISVFPTDATTVEEILRKADSALYTSKREGKDRVTIFAEDRREGRRYGVDWFVVTGNSEQKEHHGVTNNISQGGMAFECDDECRVGEEISLTVIVPSTNEKFENIISHVAWIKEIHGAYKFRVGVRFEKGAHLNELKKAINSVYEKMRQNI